jgi:FRG domain
MTISNLEPTSFQIKPRAQIKSLEDFLSKVFKLRKDKENRNRKLYYRGHSKGSYRLYPSIGRPQRYMGNKLKITSDQERFLLHRFRRRAYPSLNRIIPAGEAIFLARDHRLPTRLLDWTANALYALYFACCEETKQDGKVWAMAYVLDEKYLDPFEIADVKIEKELFAWRQTDKDHPLKHRSIKYAIKLIHPFYNSPRLLAQDGAFTLHYNPKRPIEYYEGREFVRETLDIERLYSWRVPAKSKVRIIKDLSGLGITERLMFPDLDGIAKSLWETEVLWLPKY